MRDTGTCKRQIVYDSLFEITTDEEYIAACSAPGPVWEPDETGLNPALLGKINLYLVEATKLQASAPPQLELSDDDLDRISISTPQCISQLANLRDPSYHGATFNDVAMQLCAYAVTAKKTEAETVAGCKVFIENYPSTSLNTAQKRYDNFRARFRTMMANGKQHSCAGIKALRVSGFDCSKCGLRPIFSAPVVDVIEQMTKEDLKATNLSSTLPECTGLILKGMEALRQPGMPCIDAYSFSSVITAIAGAMGGKVECQGLWPNIYNIKVGPTSSGKSASDKSIRSALKRVGLDNFYGMTSISSGPALYRGLSKNPQTILLIDEITGLFRRYGKTDIIADGKREALLSAYSESGQEVVKQYGNEKDTIHVNNPCLTVSGNATPLIFEAFSLDDFMSGMIQRFDFFVYDGDIPLRGIQGGDCESKLDLFARGIADIVRTARPRDWMLVDGAVNIKLTDIAASMLLDFSNDNTKHTNTFSESDGCRGIISRRYELAIKYALLHMGSERQPSDLFEPMTPDDLEWGITTAKLLCGWKIDKLRDNIISGDFDRDCGTFLKAIISAIVIGKRPTFNILANRRRELKNWKRVYSQDVIDMLVTRGDIIIDETKRTTAYFLVKK
jgi:hypothetical protein